ncbi:MAG: hypothetical protein Q8O38_16385 [Sulfurimicrobium sp.]|nr:hypothetical protein [Sulfurimicrobium sp.]
MNNWLEEKEPNIGRIFPNPDVTIAIAASTAKAEPETPVVTVTRNKLRRNTLDPAIDKAIKLANSTKLAEVYLKLKELALAGEAPFTGATTGDALYYMNDNNEKASLNKEALGKRLKSRR